LSRPSEPLLKWLRQQVDARGENTASLATRVGRPRAELRRVLTGVEPLTVDDLVRITEALGLSLADMGVANPEAVEAAADRIGAGDESAHWGNQPRALFKVGFDHGIDFLFLAAADELEGWGGPEAVREQHRGRDLAIQLDSQFHKFMNPRVEDDALELRLSFDTLYECRFPWTAIRRVVFTPLPPAPPEPKAPPKGKPQLRLVR
jgi:hypothetical protein